MSASPAGAATTPASPAPSTNAPAGPTSSPASKPASNTTSTSNTSTSTPTEGQDAAQTADPLVSPSARPGLQGTTFAWPAVRERCSTDDRASERSQRTDGARITHAVKTPSSGVSARLAKPLPATRIGALSKRIWLIRSGQRRRNVVGHIDHVLHVRTQRLPPNPRGRPVSIARSRSPICRGHVSNGSSLALYSTTRSRVTRGGFSRIDDVLRQTRTPLTATPASFRSTTLSIKQRCRMARPPRW